MEGGIAPCAIGSRTRSLADSNCVSHLRRTVRHGHPICPDSHRQHVCWCYAGNRWLTQLADFRPRQRSQAPSPLSASCDFLLRRRSTANLCAALFAGCGPARGPGIEPGVGFRPLSRNGEKCSIRFHSSVVAGLSRLSFGLFPDVTLLWSFAWSHESVVHLSTGGPRGTRTRRCTAFEAAASTNSASGPGARLSGLSFGLFRTSCGQETHPPALTFLARILSVPRSPLLTRLFPFTPACPSHPGGPLVRGGRKNGFNHGLPTVRGEVLSPALIACAASGEEGGT